MIYLAIAVSSILSALGSFACFIYYIKRMDKQMIKSIEMTIEKQSDIAAAQIRPVAVMVAGKEGKAFH